MKQMALLLAVIGACTTTRAGINVVPLGTAAPPTEVGGVAVTGFPLDDRIFQDVLSIPDGFGREITLNHPKSCRRIGHGWATWSHGYTGNAYYSNGRPDVTVTFPRGTKAAYIYAEPGAFSVFEISIVASDGVTTAFDEELVEGMAGAKGWGLYSTGGRDLVSVRLICDVDFSIGEFGISGPCLADLDIDGFIDFADFLLFLNYFDAGDPRADYTEDGLVDFSDYLLFLNYYGNSCEEE